MTRKKVTSVPALADWGAVDNALRDIRECQHTLAEMAVQRDRQIDKLDKDVVRYSATAQSIFIKGAVSGLIAGLVFVFGLKIMEIL